MPNREKSNRLTAASGGGDLAQARQGDRKAFSRLMEPYRREIVAYCYRLTGSLSEAEDLAQEAFVRAFGALDAFEGRATPRAWLYRIAHNLCVNDVRRRSPWVSWESLSDGVPVAPAATDREDVRLGFVALMRSLPPRQRATLVLRDVLGWSAEETARILETTVPAVKNALTRARQALARQPHGGDPASVGGLATAGPEARALLAQWVDAFEKGNTPRMVALLTAEKITAEKTGYNQRKKAEANVQEAPRTGRRAGERKERPDGQ